MTFRHWWCAVFTLAAMGAATAFAQNDADPTTMPASLPPDAKSAPADPLKWQPPDPLLEVHRVLDEARYQARKKNVTSNVRREGLQNDLYPRSGLELVTVLSDGRAAKQGFHVGDIITAVNGKPTTQGDFARAVHGGNSFTVTICKPGNPSRDVTFKQGKIGVDTRAFVDFARMYGDSGTHDPRWDDDVIVAARQCEINPELAETALAHARAAGWDDRWFDVLVCMTCAKAGRYEDAIATGLPLLKDLPKEVHAVVAEQVLNASRMSYHWHIAEQILKDYPDEVEDSLTDEFAAMAAWHRALPDDLRISRPPMEIASEVPSEDLTNSITDISPLEMLDPVTKGVWTNNIFDLETWQKDHALPFDAEDFSTYDLGPAVDNGMISAEFTCQPHAKPRFFVLDRTFGIGFIDYSPSTREGVLVLSAVMTNPGYVAIRSPEFGTLYAPRNYPAIGKTKHRITLIAVGDRVNVLVDNRPVFDGPLKPMHSDRQLLGCIWARGMDANVTGLEWRKLDVPVAATGPAAVK